MKHALVSALKGLASGLLLIAPIYLAVLLLLKGMKSVAILVKPFAHLLPASIPAGPILSLLLFLAICILIGSTLRTRLGRQIREQVEKSIFERIPGYELLRSLTQQVAGGGAENAWKPAMIDTDDGALAPAFIIEELEDGRYTVFVPSIPTPLAGAVFIYERKRVHPVDVPFTQALKVVSHWGSGAKELVAAMEKEKINTIP